ncbi:MAG: helix-turn-helix transcriptional regulator [Lachnospiraceae bacterium]|nr:helix-turn-helix transcriptional regulator [Lachnospiraceae bacterium]
MTFEKRYLMRFFLLNMCLIIPMVIISIFAVNMVANETKKIEKNTAIQRLNDVAASFEADYQEYVDESIVLFSREELRYSHITGKASDTIKAIDMLRLKRQFDNRIHAVLICYGTDYVYTSSGVATKKVYFGIDLKCQDESVNRGLDIIDSGENALTFLFTSKDDGFLMYTCYTKDIRLNQTSVSFLIPFEQIKNKFAHLQEGQFYRMELKDGAVLIVGRDFGGEIVIVPQEEWEQITNDAQYIMEEVENEILGMTTALYYKESSFGVNRGLQQLQMINMILIVAGIILSALISWSISRKRISEVVYLENVARGQMERFLKNNNVYSRLQGIITSGIHEKKEYESKVTTYELKVKDLLADMIFHGAIRDIENMEFTFRELGFVGSPKCFFVGVVSSDTDLESILLPSILDDKLKTYVINEGKSLLVFLYDLPTSNDENQVQRKHVANEIRSYLHNLNIRKVRIGLSQMYNDVMLIKSAVTEAIDVLEYILTGQIRDFCGCGENMVEFTHFLIPDTLILNNFREALKEHNLETAQKWFYHILHQYATQECSQENKQYIRYTIMQCIVQFLNEETSIDKPILLKYCLDIDITDEKIFVKNVTNVLKRCLDKKEDDNFTKMLEFIGENYMRSDLTYEEVALAGGVSKTYISKIFQAKLGMSYIEYLTRVRMDKACMLLRTSDYSIGEIVLLVGYDDTSSFRRNFKKRYGMGPTEYRKKEQQVNEKG